MTSTPPRTRGRRPATAGAPHGREEVEAALIQSAAELFSQRGPNAVSIRDVASRAGVNHGLMHRYFGSKDGLLGAVLDRFAAGVAGEVAGGVAGRVDGALDGEPGSVTDLYWRVLARSILDGRDPSLLQRDHPTVRMLVAWGRRDLALEADDAKVWAAQVLALQLGWRMFEPFLTAAAGLDSIDPEKVASSLETSTVRLAPSRLAR
ncbi:MAG: TetR/AcrR family transcriptional regulator [Actinobacteria bacterium]|nr:TetR/AcrR family transcriptional regulator [Actinomycetota bacterium]